MKSLVALALGVALLLPAAAASADSERGVADHDRVVAPAVLIVTEPSDLGAVAGTNGSVQIEPRADQEYRDR